MKDVTCYLLIFVNLILSYKILTPELPMKHCFRVTINKGHQNTILIDSNIDTDDLLKDCIIRKIHMNQSIMLLKGLTWHKERNLPNYNPNLIIMTHLLNNQLLDRLNSSLYDIIKFHWDMLYVVMTANDDTYKCHDGKFDLNTFSDIQNFMNDLWHKFEMIRVVLVFPFSCPRTYAIYGKKILTDRLLYNRTLKLIQPKTFDELSTAILKSSADLTQGYPLKATIFERFPTSQKNCNLVHNFVNFNSTRTNGFCGMDGLIMQDVINHFKFNVYFSNNHECNKYGHMNFTKNIVTGSLGCVIHQEVDISFNSRFMVLYTHDRFNYLQWVMLDSLCGLLPVPNVYPLWLYPQIAMNGCIFVPIILVIVVIALLAWFSAKMLNKFTGQEVPTLRNCITDFFTCTLFGFTLKKYCRFYLLRGLCLGCSIIILSCYQGYINYTFTTLKRYEKIKTLETLYDKNYILHTSPSVRELIKDPNNTKTADFIKRAHLQSRTDIGIVLEKNNAITLGRYSDAQLEILVRYRDKHGKPLIYIVNECFRDYYLSYITRFGFPFSREFKIFIGRLTEAGLPEVYYKWTRRTLLLPDTLPTEGPEPRPNAKIRLQDERIAFIILLTGYVLSTLAFIVEKWLAKRIWIALSNH